LIIFDCNGVLVDSERIAAAVAAESFNRIGIPLTADLVIRYFFGRRPADMFATVEKAMQRSLPPDFAAEVATATIERLREDVRPMPHAAHALTWLREPKCVASSAPKDRMRISLETAGLDRFFEGNLFSASDVSRGKPAPDLFLHAAEHMDVPPGQCIVVEDSPAGVTAAAAAGMTPVGFVGGCHAEANLANLLVAAGARSIVADLRHLKGTIVSLRGC
jgi:HAD superfamily hydrolase (TIGR01509 family)